MGVLVCKTAFPASILDAAKACSKKSSLEHRMLGLWGNLSRADMRNSNKTRDVIGKLEMKIEQSDMVAK